MEKLLDAQETASYLHISISTLYRWIHQKKINFVKIGSRVLFTQEIIQELIRNKTINSV